jgi:hypothetical protein
MMDGMESMMAALQGIGDLSNEKNEKIAKFHK